jgi:type III restriction enzyme
MDTSRWEQSASYYIDTHEKVAAFVKNQGLGFAIPYLHNGQAHDYVPDFLIRLVDGTNVILETKGHDELAEVKEGAALRWVAAVNADGSFGRWAYKIAYNPNDVPRLLTQASAEAPMEDGTKPAVALFDNAEVAVQPPKDLPAPEVVTDDQSGPD